MLIKKGAEANIYLEYWYGIDVIKKVRIQKAYRLPDLDLSIRRSRTAHEAQMMHKAKLAGVPTPFIYLVDLQKTTIIMDYVDGVMVKEALSAMDSKNRVELCLNLGRLIGKLHVQDICHGDLTTSNMILTSNGKIFFIDFGLAEYSGDIEKKGTDLLLIKRALQSTHYSHAKETYTSILQSYKEVVGNELAEKNIDRANEIEKRGRYFSDR